MVIAVISIAMDGQCQQTVFALLRNEIKLGDEYYEEKNYLGALQSYRNAARKDPGLAELQLKIGRCYYSLKQFPKAIAAYDACMKHKGSLPWADLYNYAEAQSATGNYGKASEYFQKYLVKEPDNELIIKKIWRLNNIQYLYEDSMHYAVRRVSLNTESGELCAVPYQNGIVFMSNRKEPQLVDKINAAVGAPFYKLYFSKILPDTASQISGAFRYGKAFVFNKELSSTFNAGPVAFYGKNKKMVFVASSHEAAAGGARTLQLHFAEIIEGTWRTTQSFPYNNSQYSISDPTISNDGKVLFFSSDMKGGFGGKDLYKSVYVNGKWSRPVNLGETINTAQDEVFPYLYQDRALYFSSNGHAGLGGLDIFKALIKSDGYDEPQNAGYPLNTSYDDFGIVIDSLETHGYFSSNRVQGGFNDDLYEFDMDLQRYPLTISGLIKYREHAWSDSSELKLMGNARIYLIDNVRKVSVHESTSDRTGNFSLIIPYFSNYIVRVVGEDGDEHMAVLEIPKHRKELSSYEIVMIKDIFKPQENQR
jgi:hypothetical protein